MCENRNLKRQQLIFYLKIDNQKDNKLLGHLADITTEGIMIVGSSPIPLNENYSILIDLKSINIKKDFINLDIQTLWNKNDANPELTLTGAKFLSINDESKKDIERLIELLGFV
jgi:PilZ domain